MAKRLKSKKSKLKVKHPADTQAIPSIERIRKTYLGADKKYREALYICIENVCKLEQTFREDGGEAKQFCNEVFWKGRRRCPDPDKQEKWLHYMFVFMCGDTPDAGKNASLYKRAAEVVLTSGVPREEIAKAIKDRGGIRKLTEADKAEAEPEEPAVPEQEATGGEASKSKVNGKHGEAKKAMASDAGKSKAIQSRSPQSRRETSTLYIEIDEDYLPDILERPDQSIITLWVRLDGVDPSGHKRLILEDSDVF